MNDMHEALREVLGVGFDENEVRWCISGTTKDGKTEWLETTSKKVLKSAKESAKRMGLENVKVERLTRGEIWARFGKPEGAIYSDKDGEHASLVLDVPYGVGVQVIR